MQTMWKKKRSGRPPYVNGGEKEIEKNVSFLFPPPFHFHFQFNRMKYHQSFFYICPTLKLVVTFVLFDEWPRFILNPSPPLPLSFFLSSSRLPIFLSPHKLAPPPPTTGGKGLHGKRSRTVVLSHGCWLLNQWTYVPADSSHYQNDLLVQP